MVVLLNGKTLGTDDYVLNHTDVSQTVNLASRLNNTIEISVF